MLNTIKDRPLLFFVLSFFFGMVISPLLPFTTKAVLTVLLLTVIFVTASQRRPLIGKMRKVAVTLPILIGIIFGTVYQYFAVEKPKDEITALSGSEKEIIAVVEEVSFSEEYFTAYKVRVVRIEDEKVGFSCALSIPYDIGAEENDVLRLKVMFNLPEKESYGFSLREYYSSRGIYVLAESTDENARVIGFDRSIPSFFRNLSNGISVKLKTSLGREHGGFVSGLLIGRKSDIPDSVTTSFRYLGISHVLSVSGLHLAILAGTLVMFLKALTVRRSVRYLITFGFIIFFILLTGSPPSVIRSGIMLILLLMAEVLGRDYDPITSLSIAAFVIVLFSPTAIYDAGFILSVSATAGIVLLGSPVTKWLYHISDGKSFWLRIFTRLLTVISLTASATVFTLPAIWYFFGETSSVSLLSNILFIPLITALMYLSVLFLIFYRTPLAPSLSGITSSMAELVTDLSDGLMKILPPPIDLTYSFTFIPVTIALCVLTVLLIKKKRALALVLSLSTFALSYFGCLVYYDDLHKGEENIVYSSVNGNDYIIVNTDNKTLLCDFSDGGYSSARRVTELIQPKLHDTSVDTILLTHLHRKHIDMISRLSDNGRIKQLYIPSPQNDDENIFAEAIRDSAKNRGIEVITYNSDRDVTFDFSGIKITLYKKAYIKRSVQPLHLMKIEGKRDFLYVGSAVFESELNEKALSLFEGTEVLFLGAHGPLIKKPLIPLDFEGEVLASNIETNEAYQTSYTKVGFYKKYITR
ncbi:MAG: ComEC/Rec2 family competence protein [Clostridia bacterium]|nr:ComEC/Rec2 family competence protein [Clostridia bacterium]